MAKYVLVCPECGAYFKLRRYIPERRVRCRKCRGIMMIPKVEGAEAQPPKEQKTARSMSRESAIRGSKWVILISLLSLTVLAWVVILSADKLSFTSKKKKSVKAEQAKEEKDALERFNRYNGESHFPLSLGTEWVYAGKGFTEHLRVTHTNREKKGLAYIAQVEIVREHATTRHILKVTDRGAFLTEEDDGVNYYRYDPPLLLVRFPLREGDRWEWDGAFRKLNDDTSVKGKLTFSVGKAKALDLGHRVFTSLPVQASGRIGETLREETSWYALATGLVQRQSLVGASEEEIRLKSYRKIE